MGEAPGSAQPLLHGLLCPGEMLMSLLVQTNHGQVTQPAAPREVHPQHSRTGASSGTRSRGHRRAPPGRPQHWGQDTPELCSVLLKLLRLADSLCF